MYTCNECGYASISKLGKCPECGAFGSFVESEISRTSKGKKSKQGSIISHNNIHTDSVFRPLANTEFQRVLQNGIKQGGVYLLGGEPGIGKSTLILQILQDLINENDVQVRYFSGEEQANQVISRRERINNGQKFDQNKIQIYYSTNLEDIISTSQDQKPDCIIIDSIQTIYSDNTESASGSPNQVKYCAEKLSEFAKTYNCTVIIIGHVTKGGEIAGPKYLEHIVDVVLYIQGDRFDQLRFLRSAKNRFGHTDDSGIFEMTLFGLNPVYDLKERILQSTSNMPGSVLSIGLDNGRPVIAHIEVLLNKTKYKFPQRNCIGVDPKRVDLVIAILEKYLKINLGFFDIFVNIPGGFDFRDSGLDLAIAAGIYSQYTMNNIASQKIFIGELALSGKVSKSRLHEKRSKESPDGFDLIDYNNIKYVNEIKGL